MVRDGIYYALALTAAAVLLGGLTTPWLAVVPLLLALFFLWFFRDPEREIPTTPGAVVSPADGKVTEVAPVPGQGEPATRISIFLSVFDVHVNRAPVSGVVQGVEYRAGKYLNAMDPNSAEQNEQSICTLVTEGGQRVIFKQIAGLLARRIVFTPKVGQRLERGERVGLIKFGSRCDLIPPAAARVLVQPGQRVQGGSSTLAILPDKQGEGG
jgi:phosphatidylserine decarboxylase